MTYHQPVASAQHELKVKGSRFIVDIFPVKSEAEALEQLEGVRKREHGATHHCFAYVLGTGNELVHRVNDDGEPAGTAGKPIYAVLAGAGMTNVLAVVTRYFGGVKLGKGGLIRAYGGVVQEALPLLRTEKFIPTVRMSCQVSFEQSNLVYRLIETYSAELMDQQYSDHVTISFKIPQHQAEQAAWELFQASNGQVKAEIHS